MLIFSPTYDVETVLCTKLAGALGDVFAAKTLLSEDAKRGGLLQELNYGNHPKIIFIGHGSIISIAEGPDVNALNTIDFSYIQKPQTVFAYTCHSAVFGRDSAEKGWVWWGYDNVMRPPPFDDIKRKHAVEVFRVAINCVDANNDVQKVKKSIELIKNACDKAARKYEKGTIRISMSESMFFRHVWSRLRIWLPNAEKPISHEDTFGGQLDYS